MGGNTDVDETEETEDSTTDTDDTEGSEGEDDSSNDSTETSEDTDEGGSDESVEQYLDVKSVPPHLSEMAKRMQASHTKKMQALVGQAEKKVAELVQAKEAELSNKYTKHIANSAALAELAKHPDFVKFYDDIANGRPYGSSARGNGKVEDDDAAGETVGSLTVVQLAQKLAPVMQRFADRSVKPLLDRTANEELEKASKTLLNFTKHKPEILRLVAERGYTVEEAHSIAAREDLIAAGIAAGMKKAGDEAKQIPKKTEKGGTGKGATVLSEKSKMTLKESIQHAIATAKT